MKPRRAYASTLANSRPGVVLLAVLVVTVLLSLAAYQYSELMTAEYRAADAGIRAAQARTLALSGLHYTTAALADANTLTNTLNSNPYDNESFFRGVSVHNDDRPRFNGRFSVMAPPAVDDAIAGSTQTRFGVVDESSKINLNALVQSGADADVIKNILLKLPNMTDEIADAIIDWIDADDDQRPSGAENQYYSGLTNGYRCKNGPLDSVEELLLVRGVTPELLFGTDKNRNGRQDAADVEGSFDPGWVQYLTVYSREQNKDTTGAQRINVNDSDLSALYDKLSPAVGEELANWIVAYRKLGPGRDNNAPLSPTPLSKSDLTPLGNSTGNRISGVYALFDQSVVIVAGRNARRFTCPLANPTKQKQLLGLVYDKCSTKADAELLSRVNVNTAPKAVLAALPQLEESDVQTILDARPAPGDNSDPIYQTPAWLLTEAKLPRTKLTAIEPYVTAQTQTYRVQSLGYFDSGGPAARVEAVIDTNGGKPRIVYFRDLTELGRGFDLPR